MSKVYIEIEGMLGRSVPQKGTIIIDRTAKTLSVRPFRSRDEFIFPLKEIAEYVAFKTLQTMAMETRVKHRVRKVSRGLLGGLR